MAKEVAQTVTTVKEGLITGIGELYLQIMTTDTDTPVYNTQVLKSPVIDKLAMKLEFAEKEVWLSSMLHSNFGRASKVEVTLDAGYLPTGFIEEVTGSKKLAEGIYAQTSLPTFKFFRLAFAAQDENGKEIIFNMPRCQIKPKDWNFETATSESKEQIQQFVITAFELPNADPSNRIVYNYADLRNETAATTYDRNKLLEKGFYNAETLALCTKAAAV